MQAVGPVEDTQFFTLVQFLRKGSLLHFGCSAHDKGALD